MSPSHWPLLEHFNTLLEREQGATRKEPGGRLKVVILYPNTYQVGMANLGLAVVYRLINARADALCERAFLPDAATRPLYDRTRAPLLSLESGRPVAEFDLVLATVSFENDAPNLAAMLELAGLSGGEGTRPGPLVVAGGVAAMLNPEPMAHLVDAFLLGEAEAALPAFLDRLMSCLDMPKAEALLKMAQGVPGFYAPGFYAPAYLPDGRLASFTPTRDVPERIVTPKYLGPAKDLARGVFLAPGAEFGDMRLMEVGRGCPHGCRFCAAGHVFRPPRLAQGAELMSEAAQAVAEAGRVGLVSAAVSDLPQAGDLAESVVAAGGEIGVSSLRADCLEPSLARALAQSGNKTVALAPEAGSQRLRRMINKHMEEDDLARAVEILVSAGVLNLRLYFMVGLPGEEHEDLEELCALAKRVRQQMVSLSRPLGRVGQITISLNPFIPKPFTPFQWESMLDLKGVKKRLNMVKKNLARVGNLKVVSETPKYALMQAALSRGDRRLALLLPRLARGEDFFKAMAGLGLDPGFYACRRRERDELLPWAFVDHGISMQYLWREAQKAREARQSPPCEPETCRRCGVCRDVGPETKGNAHER